MLLRQIFDPYLAQYAYLIGCQRTGEALVIVPGGDSAQLAACGLWNEPAGQHGAQTFPGISRINQHQ